MHANYDNDVRTSVIIGGYTADTETQWFFDQFMFSHLILVIKILNDPLSELIYTAISTHLIKFKKEKE